MLPRYSRMPTPVMIAFGSDDTGARIETNYPPLARSWSPWASAAGRHTSLSRPVSGPTKVPRASRGADGDLDRTASRISRVCRRRSTDRDP